MSPTTTTAATPNSPLLSPRRRLLPSLSSPDGLVHVVTAVWRAGFASARTDHSAVCFGVDCSTGKLLPGTTAAHWYRLGGTLGKALRALFAFLVSLVLPAGLARRAVGGGRGGARAAAEAAGRPGDPTAGSPPGARWSFVPETGLMVAGRPFPGWADACAACVRAHRELLLDVPLVGWDVAIVDEDQEEEEDEGESGTPRSARPCRRKNRPLLLEANLSLNFFGGPCDRAGYASFVVQTFAALAEAEERGGV